MIKVIAKKLNPKSFGIAYNKESKILVIGLYYFAVAFAFGNYYFNSIIKKSLDRRLDFLRQRRSKMRKKNRKK